MRSVRGREIAIIFQEPMTSLNPVMRIGEQIEEAILVHEKVSKREASSRAVELLGACRHSRPRGARAGLSAPAFGRHAPARR